MSTAARCRRYRQRKRAGRIVFADRPEHSGGYRAFLPPEVLRLGVPDSVKPVPASEPKLCYSLANIFPAWAAAQGICGTNKWHPAIPYNPAPLTEQEVDKLKPVIDQAG